MKELDILSKILWGFEKFFILMGFQRISLTYWDSWRSLYDLNGFRVFLLILRDIRECEMYQRIFMGYQEIFKGFQMVYKISKYFMFLWIIILNIWKEFPLISENLERFHRIYTNIAKDFQGILTNFKGFHKITGDFDIFKLF